MEKFYDEITIDSINEKMDNLKTLKRDMEKSINDISNNIVMLDKVKQGAQLLEISPNSEDNYYTLRGIKMSGESFNNVSIYIKNVTEDVISNPNKYIVIVDLDFNNVVIPLSQCYKFLS